jgi:hypothetical protein
MQDFRQVSLVHIMTTTKTFNIKFLLLYRYASYILHCPFPERCKFLANYL